jgi:hypothetical protein
VDASAAQGIARPSWVRDEQASGFALLAANFPQLVQVRLGGAFLLNSVCALHQHALHELSGSIHEKLPCTYCLCEVIIRVGQGLRSKDADAPKTPN